jgi:hypothetical protein
MAEIVLVHGIDQQQKSADMLECQWAPCLAGGVRTAGFPEVADRIWRDAHKPGSIETRMAFYGSLFLAPGQQGDDPGQFTAEEAEFAEALAMEWLKRAAERATKAKVREIGGRELAYATNQMGAEQGAGSVARSAIGSLAKISWFAPFGMGFAERFVNRALAQVTRYFTNEEIRSAAVGSVFKLIGPETKVLIGHDYSGGESLNQVRLFFRNVSPGGSNSTAHLLGLFCCYAKLISQKCGLQLHHFVYVLGIH